MCVEFDLIMNKNRNIIYVISLSRFEKLCYLNVSIRPVHSTMCGQHVVCSFGFSIGIAGVIPKIS